MYWLYLTLVLSFVSSSVSLRLILKTMKQIRKDMRMLSEEEKVKYGPFIRTDKGILNVAEIIVCAYLLLPVRVLGVVLCLSLALLSLQILNIGRKQNQPAGKYRLFLIRMSLKLLSRSILFFCGVFWISRKVVKLKPHPKKTAIVISNHVSHLDSYYVLSQFCCAYVAKQEVVAYPLLGKIAIQLQSLFVDRENHKTNLLQQIEQRIRIIINYTSD